MNKNPTVPIYSQELHTPILHEDTKKPLSKIKWLILAIIIFLIAIVIAVAVFALLPRDEYTVKSKLDYLVRDYYENYLYSAFENSAQSYGNSTVEELLEKHAERGLSRITLRQLLLHDTTKTADIANYLREYCDENKTFMQIFPEPPFDRTSYRIKYTYSCNFQ